jgi:AraC-like DNA-binding protein
MHQQRYLRIDSDDFLKNYLAFIYVYSSEHEINYMAVPANFITINLITCGSADVIFNEENGNILNIPNEMTSGLIKKSAQVKMSKNYREVSIGFQPHLFHSFVKEDMVHIANGFNQLSDNFCKQDIDDLVAQLQDPINDDEILNIIKRFLLKSLVNNLDKRTSTIIKSLQNNPFQKINDVAKEFLITERNLGYLFNKYIGISPKEFTSILRMNKTFLLAQNHSKLTDIAYEAGYFDQSHFTRDFQKTTGYAPSVLLKDKVNLSDFYNFRRIY